MDDIALERLIFQSGIESLQPEPSLLVSEWADENRILSQVASAEPGKWRTERTPYLKEIMDSLSTDSPYERVVFMKGSQIGATEAGNNWIGYIIDNAPGPMLLILPTVDMAKDNSKTRIEPMIFECPSLLKKVSEPRSRDGSNTMLLKEFPGGFLAMTGANSPASLRSKPIRYVFLDEVDSYPGDVGGEGDPVNLAITRTRTFSRRKIFLCSTPTISGHSRIEELYEGSNKMRYYVPCPRCGACQVLKWQNVKWEQGKPESAWYECEYCGGKIYNHEKEEMLTKGSWRPEVKNYRGKTAGFHLSSLYSPSGWFSWGMMASMFLEAKQDPDLLKVFVNTCLGETWVERGDAPEWEKLFMRRESYERGKVPQKGLILIAGCDVQKDRLEVQIVAYGRSKETWSVDYKIFPGDTADLNSVCWKMLSNLIHEPFPHESGVVLYIRTLAIDTGYNTQTVYNFCRRFSVDKVMPIKGQSTGSAMVGQMRAVDVLIDGKKKTRALKIWPVNVSMIKQEVYSFLKYPNPSAGEEYPAGFMHFPEYEEEFFRQLTAEYLCIKEVNSRKVFEWRLIRPRNEALDTTVYARAAAGLLQIDKFRLDDWERLEKLVIPEGVIQNSAIVGQNTATQKAMMEYKEGPGPKRRTISKGINLED